MSSKAQAIQGGSVRLWIDPPYEHETLSSFLDRAAGYHRMDRMALVKLLIPDLKLWGHLPDFDGPMAQKLVPNLLNALGWHEEQEPLKFCTVPYESLRPNARHAYCPICFREDLKAKRTPYFRWDWAVPYLTICHEHGAPLCDWPKRKNHQRVLPQIWCADPKIEHAGECPWFAEHLAFAESAVLELADSSSALHQLYRFQECLLELLSKPSFLINGKRISWIKFMDIVKDGLTWGRHGEPPPASEACPVSTIDGLFVQWPVSDYEKSNRKGAKGFRQQKLTAWRRTVMWFVFQKIKD